MPAFVALLRAVNVGGTGKLAMRDLKSLCEAAGFTAVATYIASGNVVFRSPDHEGAVQARLEEALTGFCGRSPGLHVRDAAAMAAVVTHCPFVDRDPSRTVAIFLDAAPDDAMLQAARGRRDEAIACGTREIYIHYGGDMGRSKLVIPAASAGTARNMNTIAKLAAMAAAL